MAFGFECEGDDCDEFIELDPGEDAPCVSIREIFVEGGEAHQRDREDVHLCEDCKDGAYKRAIEAARSS